MRPRAQAAHPAWPNITTTLHQISKSGTLLENLIRRFAKYWFESVEQNFGKNPQKLATPLKTILRAEN